MSMKFITLIFAIVVTLIIGLLSFSFFIPKEKTTEISITVQQPFFLVWAAITDHYEEPKWRNNIDTIIQLDNIERDPVWREFYTNGDSITWRIITEVSNKLLVQQIIDHPIYENTFWAININTKPEGTTIQIVKEQHINNSIQRLIHYFDPIDYDLKLYLSQLYTKLNTPQEEDSFGW